MSPLPRILCYALIPAAAIIFGGLLALLRPPGARVRSSIQHFAAGLVFAALATELLPDIMHQRAPVAVIIGFALGVALMLAIKSWTKAAGQERIGETTRPTSLLVTLGVDIAIDGLLIGVGFAAGAKQGVLLTVALAFEVMFLGVSGAVALAKVGTRRGTILLIVSGLAALMMIGAAIGGGLLAGLSGVAREIVLSFGAAALLYLVTEELLVEAHEEPETPLLAAMFFVGFVALLVIEMLAA